MLEIDNGNLTPDEDRTQMSRWSILAAPLIAGNDLSHISPEVLEILTNAEVIAVDQNAAGKQGNRLWSQGPLEIWSKNLGDRSKVVGLFNRSAGPAEMTLDLRLLGAGCHRGCAISGSTQIFHLSPTRRHSLFLDRACRCCG